MSEAKYTRKDIVEEARNLGKMMAETEEVAFFKEAEAKINQNIKVQELIKKIKDKQKQAVNLKHYNKTEALRKAEAELEQLHEEIEAIPIVQEFQQSQRTVNDMLQLVSTTVSNSITDEIIESTGGDQLKGQTGPNPFHELRTR
ncbi:cell fate (sporulation/competence/biofilm development) regulator YmcA (YheA/YmcA/DUF963 family) [Salsuginibacillus halophilus]|uniref:Cell fate (Sporulation/competence/biofilm development) regulator YmcA (YheA/YmcA/DUF963 family) n=1 Tax=Salsuginibacillus halophilus TaxID=517424 RepID=A0A2P8HYH9_9BACI|nr:YlbF family regulator [Salsuginibacillus halophilus]PSL51267.1 cell fate (sporulation/competence/biofilm development) regulator YmcA (YheA/YmcA/DUF963 family) [Salsuginibacillus halophilus]